MNYIYNLFKKPQTQPPTTVSKWAIVPTIIVAGYYSSFLFTWLPWLYVGHKIYRTHVHVQNRSWWSLLRDALF